MQNSISHDVKIATSLVSQKWYALAVYSRQEKAALRELQTLGFTVFLPQMMQRRLWSDRVKILETALFPGYLFLQTHLDAATRVRFLKLKQVVDVVGKTKTAPEQIARAIPDSIIESIRLMVEAKRGLESINGLSKGTQVKIIQGPLKGTTGIIEEEADGKHRLIVQVSLLGRGIRTVLSVNDVWEKAEWDN